MKKVFNKTLTLYYKQKNKLNKKKKPQIWN